MSLLTQFREYNNDHYQQYGLHYRKILSNHTTEEQIQYYRHFMRWVKTRFPDLDYVYSHMHSLRDNFVDFAKAVLKYSSPDHEDLVMCLGTIKEELLKANQEKRWNLILTGIISGGLAIYILSTLYTTYMMAIPLTTPFIVFGIAIMIGSAIKYKLQNNVPPHLDNLLDSDDIFLPAGAEVFGFAFAIASLTMPIILSTETLIEFYKSLQFDKAFNWNPETGEPPTYSENQKYIANAPTEDEVNRGPRHS